jgi:Fe-S cluster biogenesis protein NfuA
MVSLRNPMRQQVESALETIRSRLRLDGCDVELEEVTDEGTVRLRFRGAGACCPMSQIALLAGIESLLRREVPGVKRVERR